jgi:hypothetical protein
VRWGAQRLGVVMVSAALLGGVAACGGSAASKSAPPTTRASDPVATLVRRYMAAMGSGRIDDALSLRCSALRKHGDQLALMKSETKRFVATNGRPSVVAVTTTEARGIAVPAGATRGRAVAVSLTYRGRPGGRVIIVSGTEHGVLRLCGYGAVTSALMLANPPPLVDLGTTTAEPHALVPEPPEPQSTVTSDEAYRSKHPVGVGGWYRGWRVGSYGGDSVTVERFGSAAEARAANLEEHRRLIADGLEQFPDPAVANVSGVRVLSEDWLWIQTPAVGPYIDEIDLQLGAIAVIASVSVLPAGSSHARVIALANDVVHRAGVSGSAAVPA